MHVGTVRINREKMSKSLNNFVLVKDLLDRYSPNAVRYFFCLTHYRNHTNFGYEFLDEAEKQVSGMLAAVHQARTKLVDCPSVFPDRGLDRDVIGKLNADFNLPHLITFLQRTQRDLNRAIKQNALAAVQTHLTVLQTHLLAFGFVVPDLHTPQTVAKIRE